MVDASGTIVANYRYNAWGKLYSQAGTMAIMNPLRYRGYYYDTETGFYYLQSRYYDPAICRFINADSYACTGVGFVSTNMFAYCRNNPANLCDTSGHFPGSLLILPLIVFGVSLLTACRTEEEKGWPEDAPFEYRPAGRTTTDLNCYSFVFDYPVCADPGYFYESIGIHEVEDYKLPDEYTKENIIFFVQKDAELMDRTVYNISSPDYLSDGAYLVVCRLESSGNGYHFAVLPPGFDCFDKPGSTESRYGKLDINSDKWIIGDHVYDSDPIYFAYIPR